MIPTLFFYELGLVALGWRIGNSNGLFAPPSAPPKRSLLRRACGAGRAPRCLRLAAIDNPRRLNQSYFALPHGQTVPEVRGLRLSSSARRAERG